MPLRIVLFWGNTTAMPKSQFLQWFLSVFAFVLCGAGPAIAQSPDDVRVAIDKLLLQDFRKMEVTAVDSPAVNNLLKRAKNYTESRNDSALVVICQTVIQARNAGLLSKVSVGLEELGEYYLTKENFGEAIHWFIQALKIEEKRENRLRIADMNDLLGVVYYYQEIFPRSLEYYQKALALYQSLRDTLGIAKSLRHIGALYNSHEYCQKRTPEQKKTDYETALKYLRQSLELLEKKKDQEGIVHLWSNIGNLYRRMGQLEKAHDFTQRAVDYYRQTKNMNQLIGSLRALGLVYNRQQKYDQALACLLECQQIGTRNKLTDGIQFLYEDIAETYKRQHNYENSLAYYIKYMILRDSIYNNEKSRQIFELETRYQTEKKQQEIDHLTFIKQQRTKLNYILVFLLILISVISFLFWRNIRNKKIIAEQNLILKEKQIQELEKERQLIAARSLLEGEETERARLAGDLHDGLGGLLSGVKLKLSFMKENAVITHENLSHFSHALDLLDSSISELRRVAHNLMPETLMHYGLRIALNDFIRQVVPEGQPIIGFNTFGGDLRFSKELEITVYRITQELITNAVKHAHAKRIDVQLFTEPNRICVQVIDNGIGFDPEMPDPESTGKGLKNIRDRAIAFHGHFEILSQPGKGTETTVEFFVN